MRVLCGAITHTKLRTSAPPYPSLVRFLRMEGLGEALGLFVSGGWLTGPCTVDVVWVSTVEDSTVAEVAVGALLSARVDAVTIKLEHSFQLLDMNWDH